MQRTVIWICSIGILLCIGCAAFQPGDIDRARVCVGIAQSCQRGLKNVVESKDAVKITAAVAECVAEWDTQGCNDLLERAIDEAKEACPVD